jgi:hypothetical protein
MMGAGAMPRSASSRGSWPIGCAISRNVLPHEPALRRHLKSQRMSAVLDVEDIVQEVYGAFADMSDVEEVRDPRRFMFGIAHNILRKHPIGLMVFTMV